MSLNKHDRKEVEKQAKSNGYSWNSDGTKMTNGNGGSVQFSSTGGSVSINGSKYNDTYSSAKSTKWGGK